MSKLENALDECIVRLTQENASIEDCLVRYPDHAAELRRLLEAVNWLQYGRQVQPSPTFKARTKAKLTRHMTDNPRPAGFWERLLPWRVLPVFGRSLNTAVGLAAILVLFLSTGTVLAQSALPGDPLYGWKLTSEQVLRQVHPNPLSVDMMIAQRRLNDLTRTGVGTAARGVALSGYETSLDRLAMYDSPQAQDEIQRLLQGQEDVLAEANIPVPRLNQLLAESVGDTLPAPTATQEQARLVSESQSVRADGHRLTYNLTLTNQNLIESETVILRNELSENQTYFSSNYPCDPQSGQVICNFDLAAGETAAIEIVTEVNRCYVGDVGNNVEIFISNEEPVSTSPFLLGTTVEAEYPTPAEVAYVKSSVPNYVIGLVDENGNTITDSLHTWAAAPAWSPDEDGLAFVGVEGVSQLGGSYSQGVGLWLVDLVNQQAVNPQQFLNRDHIKSIAWSPDGRYFAAEVEIVRDNVEVAIVDRLEPDRTFDLFRGEHPAWKSDDRLVVKGCFDECGLWEVDLNGEPIRQLTFNGPDSYPAFSPDGRYMAYSSFDDSNNSEIYLMDFENNRQVRRLTNRDGTDTTPVFGPCGQNLYLRTDHFGDWKVTVMNLDGNEERTVVSDVGATSDWGLARPAVR